MTSFDRRTFLSAAAGSAVSLTAPSVAAAPAVTEPRGPWTGEGNVARGGGRLHYATLGEGPPLVLMPKLGGWIADWRKAAPVLAASMRVIAIDPPGHGGSTMLGPPPYVQSVAESAAMVIATLDELGVERFAFAGNSLGGVIGVTIAAFWPERLTRLALVGVSLGASPGYAGLRKLDAEVNPADWGKDWLPLPRSAAADARFGTIDQSVHLEQNASRAKAGRWVRPSERGAALADTAAKLTRIAAPTMLINADRGPYARYEAIGRERIRDVRVAHVANSGAFVHQERPAETGSILRDFFAA